MKKSIFTYSSYKQYMSDRLTGGDNRGLLTKAAQEMNCQRSYLSRVILDELHLTQEHAFKLCHFLGLDESEREHFQNLLEFERAGDPVYKAHLQKRISVSRAKNETVKNAAERGTHSDQDLKAEYFSTWLTTAIHFITAIPRFQTAEAIAKRLDVKVAMVEDQLKFLESLDLIEKKKDRWVYKTGEFHLEKNSPLVNYHHQNWRARALLEAQERNSDSIHFTGVLTLSEEDFQKLREVVFQFITQANRIAGPSKPEEAVAINLDLFKI